MQSSLSSDSGTFKGESPVHLGVLNDATPVMCLAWSWVTAKFYKPAGQQEEGAPDEQLTKQEDESNVQEKKSHTGVHVTVCVCAM